MATKTLKKAAKKALKKKLTKAEMRVAVAKDALKQLELEKYKACRGTYVDWNLEDKIRESDEDEQVQKIIKEHESTCQICARGALLMSSIRKFNDVTVKDFNKNWEKKSKQIFSTQTLELAEIAFERWNKLDHNAKQDRAYNFGIKYSYDNERLKAILKNIIANKGEFKP